MSSGVRVVILTSLDKAIVRPYLAKNQMSFAAASVARVKNSEVFLLADSTLRAVIDSLTQDELALPAPAEWSRSSDPTLRDIVAAHVRDEAWVPDVLAGRTIEDVGDTWNGDLVGDDPIAAYDRANDRATAAVVTGFPADSIVHLSYGDFPVDEFFEHTLYYRTFQAWSIAHLVGRDIDLPPKLVDAVWDLVMPQLDSLRAINVFPPEVEVEVGADKQTRLLGKTGFLFD
jgi:hypothetical protein